MSDAESDGNAESREAVVLDHLPHGRTEDDRPQYQKQPLAYAMDIEVFGLWEMVVDDPEFGIGDRIDIDDDPGIEQVYAVDYEDLPGGAQSELEYAVEDLVAGNSDRFVDFYNEAQPITLRLHQLNLLPGIGKKLRNSILDERKRRPFGSFDDLESRISGLHDPEGVLVERIIEEIREEDLKYRIFAREE